MKVGIIKALTAGILPATIVLHAEAPQVNFGGQIRTRTEINRKSAAGKAKPVMGTGLRTRFGANATVSHKVSTRVEIQDSRLFGGEEEASPGKPHTASIGGGTGTLDLHQGFVDFKTGPVNIRLGRQKSKLGSQRFLSSLEWHPNARVFDGISARYPIHNNTMLTGLVFQVRDSSIKSRNDYLLLSGLHGAFTLLPNLEMEFYGFYESSGRQLSNYDFYYIGARISGSMGILLYEEEFIYQGGEVGPADKSAFYQAARVGLKSSKTGYGAVAGLDILSGDNTSAEKSQYVPNYYFAHAYFGWMDYFAVNPANGVIDIRLDLDAPLWDWLLIKWQNHYFLQHKSGGNNDGAYGWEFDLELHGRFFKQSNIILGVGVFLPDEGARLLASAGSADNNTGLFFYLMPIFNF